MVFVLTVEFIFFILDRRTISDWNTEHIGILPKTGKYLILSLILQKQSTESI